MGRRLVAEAGGKEEQPGESAAVPREEEGTQRHELGVEQDTYLGPGLSLGLIFVLSVCVLALVLYTFPELDE